VGINYFHILRTCIRPKKADTPLIIYTDAVLTGTVTFECFNVIIDAQRRVNLPAA